MATIVLGQHPARLEVRLVRGDSASLLATLTDSAGVALNWPAVPSLQFADGRTKVAIVSHVATVAGSTATWSLTAAQVEVIAAASEKTGEDWLSTLARITLPDTDDITGSVEYAGEVTWSDGWSSSARTQQVTFTLPGGPAGPAGAAGATGPAGPGVAAGGTTDQILAKASSTDYATKWVDAPTGGGAGAVTSVAGRTGVVVLTSSDVGLGNVNNTADSAKPVSTAQAAADATVLSSAATDATTKANAAQAAAVQRANHTGTQSADTLTDGTTNKAFLATERTKLTGIATGATANSADATLLARGNHTGTQSADTLTDGTTNKAFLATERTKLTGIATGATANSADATLLARANHTGTQAQSTVTNLVTDLAGKAATSHTHVATTDLTATGTKDATTFLRGDNTWAVPAGGGGGLARRGGVYRSPNTAFSASTVTLVELALVSGDADLLTSGDIVIPSGAAGVWSVSATWAASDGSHTRAFEDIQVNGGTAYRASIVAGEDRTTLSIILALSVADVLSFSVYSNAAAAGKRSEVTVHAYRIGA